MAHEFESGFFVKQPAWHNLGTVLAQPPTIAEALDLAGLNWQVKLEQLGRMTAKGFKKSKRWAVVRETDGAELGTVGKVWRPLQNDRPFAWFQPLVDAGICTLEAAGSLRGGARVWVLAKIVGKSDLIVPDSNDRVERYILLAHGHDGVLAIRSGITGVRVVCQNTLSAAIGENNLVRIFHHAKAEQTLEAARDLIVRANGAFDKAADAYRALAQVDNISSAQLRAYVDAVFPKKAAEDEVEALLNADVGVEKPRKGIKGKSFIFEEIERLFVEGAGNDLVGVRGTAWGAYNAMTEFLTHERGKDADSRLNNTFFGAEGARALSAAMKTFVGTGRELVAA